MLPAWPSGFGGAERARKRFAVPKLHVGGSFLRPSGCLPPTLDGSWYMHGPGLPRPAHESDMCFGVRKTLAAVSREEVPKPADGALRMRERGCAPNVVRVVMARLSPATSASRRGVDVVRPRNERGCNRQV